MGPKRKNLNDKTFIPQEEPNDEDWSPNPTKKARLSKPAPVKTTSKVNRNKAADDKGKASSKTKKLKQAEVWEDAKSHEVEHLTTLDTEDVVEKVEAVESFTDAQEFIEMVDTGAKKAPEASMTNNIEAETTTHTTINDVAFVPAGEVAPQTPTLYVPSGKNKKPKAARKKYDEEKMVAVPRPAPMPPVGEFPRFTPKCNKVYIELIPGHEKYTYRFDMDKLKCISGWFGNFARGGLKTKDAPNDPKEPDYSVANQWSSEYGLDKVFDLEYVPDRQLWFLRKTTRSILKDKHSKADIIEIEDEANHNTQAPDKTHPEVGSSSNSKRIKLQVTSGPVTEPPDANFQSAAPNTTLTACHYNKKYGTDIEMPDVPEKQLDPTHHEQDANVAEILLNLKNVTAEHLTAEEYAITFPETSVAANVNVTEAAEEVRRFPAENGGAPSDGQVITQVALNNDTFEVKTVPELPTEQHSLVRLATPPPHQVDAHNSANINETKTEGKALLGTVEQLPTPPKDKIRNIQKKWTDGNSQATENEVIDLEAGDTKVVGKNIVQVTGDHKSTGLHKIQPVRPNINVARTPMVPPRLVLQGFDNLFRTYHNIEPQFSSNNVGVAMNQVEFLFNLSTLYSLPKADIKNIRKGIVKHLFTFKRSLWKSVMDDPGRWLFLSLNLRSPSIFREAVIHIVGSRSHHAWEHDYEELIPYNVSMLINAKIIELSQAKERVDAALLKCTLEVDGIDVVQAKGNTAYDAYSYWHEWHREQTADALDARQNGRCIDAHKYQLMTVGTDKYLDESETVSEYKTLFASRGGESSADKEAAFVLYLNMMKDRAQTIAEPMLDNYSKLNNLEEGIRYLTCTTLEENDFPWFQEVMDPTFGP